MKKEAKQQKVQGKFWIYIIVGAAFLILWCFISNTIWLDKKLGSIAQQCILENNRQVADHISYRLKAGKEFVTDFAGTVGRMPEFVLTEDLLERKREAMELEELAFFSEKTGFLPQREDTWLESWMKENPEVWEKPLVSYVKDKSIFFSSPVKRDGQVSGLVIGMQSYGAIQELVNRENHHGEGSSVLLDLNTRERIIADGDSSLPVSDEELEKFLKSVEGKEHYVSEEEIPQLGQVFVDVCRVENTSWVQVAVIPSDYLREGIKTYMDTYMFLFACVVFIFLVLIRKILRDHKRKEKIFLTDKLTGCLNREGFLKYSAKLTEDREYHSYVIVYLNVVNFRYINESWGESDGNEVLKFIGRKISERLKREEQICRSGMDHFFLLLKEDKEETVVQRLEEMIREMNKIIGEKFSKFHLGFTIGACRLERPALVSDGMNKAIYVSGLNRGKDSSIFFDQGIANRVEREKWMNETFEESLKNHDFKVYLQPKVATRQGKASEAEALVRWIHPKMGMISPGDFIPLFEKNGKIMQLDLYMFEEVCRLVERWIRENRPVTRISVNLSRYHLRAAGSDMWKEYKRIKEQYQIPDGVLELELTETVLLEDNQISFVKAILDNFRSCGFLISLDDFGFAYSSLSLLKNFQVDVLKLDRDFFVNENERSRKIVENIISLAHSLGMQVIAEGIEQWEQVEVLRSMECDMIQGYVYSKPLPVEEFEKWRNS